MEIKIIRKIDELGRLVVPKDIRTTLDIQDGDELEFTVENGALVVRKHSEEK